MCGINGIYGISSPEVSIPKIEAMNNRLAQRGPNDKGVYAIDKIALGHRRLSIIDLSSAGHQPMHSFDKRYTMVYNGELYNYLEIKNELSDYLFQTNTDSEVILAAFSKWGADCLNRFNGMYAFAIWDNANFELFIARDRLGIKPLYYYYNKEVLVFSSELRSVLASGLVAKKLNEGALPDYIRYQTVHAPQTIIEGVNMLLPGHYLRIGVGKSIEVKQYWKLSTESKKDADLNYPSVCNKVKQLLTKSVQRHLVADVPFGAFLSGGIDSCAIVAIMSQVSTKKVQTFSVTFDEAEFSEAVYAQMVANKFNTEHHEIKLKINDFVNELPHALKALDHPSGDGPNTYIVSKATKNAGITMALSGLGGDELFAGYDVFKRSISLQNKNWVSSFPAFSKSFAAGIYKTIKPGIVSEKIGELLECNTFELVNTYPLARKVYSDSEIKKFHKGELKANRVFEIIRELKQTKNNILGFVSMAEISTYMQNVLLRDTDQMSMAHALEVRVPFLDYTLVEYVLGITDSLKYPHTPKKLLVDSLGDLLPNEIVNRPKMGFTLPWDGWMKKEIKDFCEQKMNALASRGYFNEKETLDLWQHFMNGDKRITWSRIWYLVVLENWLQENNIQ